jgi:hypothetical protein
MMRDIDKPDYPLPCDPETGTAWWRFNMILCLYSQEWVRFQKDRSMRDLVPVINWLLHGAAGGAA